MDGDSGDDGVDEPMWVGWAHMCVWVTRKYQVAGFVEVCHVNQVVWKEAV